MNKKYDFRHQDYSLSMAIECDTTAEALSKKYTQSLAASMADTKNVLFHALTQELFPLTVWEIEVDFDGNE